MKPARCEHDVILCDRCMAKPKDSVTREEALVMARRIAELRQRVRDLEQQLADRGDEAHELRDQIRQLQVVNTELRMLRKV